MSTHTLEEEALHLPVQLRARLAQRLLASLDDLSEAELEQLWMIEAQQRAQQIDRGEVRTVSSDELDQKVQAQLK